MIKHIILFGALIFIALGCKAGSPTPSVNSNTNWLKSCNADAECGEEDACICNVCTVVCQESDDCGDTRPGAVCVFSEEVGEGEFCVDNNPQESICLSGCEDENGCSEGAQCINNICVPQAEEITPTCDTCHEQRFTECLEVLGEEEQCREQALLTCHQTCTTQECLEDTRAACSELGGDDDECTREAEGLCAQSGSNNCFARSFSACFEQNQNEEFCTEQAQNQCAQNGCNEEAYTACLELGHSDSECQQSARLQCEPNDNNNNDEEDCFERLVGDCQSQGIDSALCEEYFNNVCTGQNGVIIEECVEALFGNCENEQNQEECLQDAQNVCGDFANAI